MTDELRFVIGFAAGAVSFGWLGLAIGQQRGFRKARRLFEETFTEPLAVDLMTTEGGHYGESS